MRVVQRPRPRRDSRSPQTPQLAVGRDQPLEHLVVPRVRHRVHLLQLLAERGASTPQEELLQPRPDLLRVPREEVAVERFERQRRERRHDLLVPALAPRSSRSRGRRGRAGAAAARDAASSGSARRTAAARSAGTPRRPSEEPQHLALDLLLRRGPLDRLRTSDRASRELLLEREHDRTAPRPRRARPAGARTRSGGTGSPSRSSNGTAAATAALCPSMVERSCRPTVRRTMYSTSGTAVGRELARRASPPRASTKSAGSRPSGRIRTTGWTGNRSTNSKARSAARAPASSESNASTIRCANRDASRKWPSPSAVPHVATVFVTPALHHRDHVGVALDEEGSPSLVADAFARCRLYRTSPLRYTGVSGEFRYFGPSSPATGEDRAPDPDRLAGEVVHRERDPAPEPVADVALLVLDRETGLDQQLGRERLHQPPEQEVRVGRARTRPRTRPHVAVDPARLEVGRGPPPLPWPPAGCRGTARTRPRSRGPWPGAWRPRGARRACRPRSAG